MKVERFESGLQPRTWSFNRVPAETGRQLVLISDGAGEAEGSGERLALSAPALLWLGRLQPGRLRMAAGATGFRATLDGEMVLSALGDPTWSTGLERLVDRDFVLSLADHRDQAGLLERCLGAALQEMRQPQPASRLLLSALLRIILVAVLRVSGGEEIAPAGAAGKAGLLQRFRQLVEMNFRSHWSVGRYAAALGISTDRLHSICTSALGKSPKALISERLAREAAARLERSSLTVEQLGHSLGFGDPAHFSSFFRRMTGMPPGAYRRRRLEAISPAEPQPAVSFAEWP